MKLKRYLKNSAKAALLFSLALLALGCSARIEPSYKEKDIPEVVKRICKDEYNLDVVTIRTGNTLWIYAPLNKILDKDFGAAKDKFFDEEVADKLRNILTTIGRVIISSDKAPEFFALLASDINLGLDYTIIGNVLDTKKSYAGFLPWTEANKRFVINIQANPEAIGDKTGVHLKAYDIKLPDFLAKQIAQRIELNFRQKKNADNFEVTSVVSEFLNKSFTFDLNIKKIGPEAEKIELIDEALKIAAFVIDSYEFKDFEALTLRDLNSNKSITFGKLTLEKFK